MLLILIGQCQTKHIERNLNFDGFWTCSVLPDHWRSFHLHLGVSSGPKSLGVQHVVLQRWDINAYVFRSISETSQTCGDVKTCINSF